MPLSETRRTRIIFEATDTFNRSCIGRLILTPSSPRSEDGFRKIGINHIVDRIWFVDGTFGEATYAIPSGAQYGMAIAEGEAELVLRRLFEFPRIKAHETSSDPTEQDILQSIHSLRVKGFEPNAIIASVDQSVRFWEFAEFSSSGNIRRGLTSPEGNFSEVPVYYSRLVPDGAILTVDSKNLGVLEVKKDFEITVSDIENDERERIKRDAPSLSGADLSEKVRILCYEIVKATIAREAFDLVMRKGTKLELKQVS